jgi:hypothetical protein
MQGADTGAMRRSAGRMSGAAAAIADEAGQARAAVEAWRWVGADADAHRQSAGGFVRDADGIASDLRRLADDVRHQAAEQDRVSA